MIPKFTASGLLPEGIHWSDMHEVQERYGYNEHRRRLISGLERALVVFRAAGCALIYLDGSFVTEKEFPRDYDTCWEANGVVVAELDPVLLDFSNLRAAQKAKYFGEFFPASSIAEGKSPFRTFLNFFQADKATGEKKGIVGVKLKTTV